MSKERKISRLELSFPVLVELGGVVKRQRAANVSEQGMLFLAAEPYALGVELNVTFCLPSTDVELTVLVEVIHITWVNDRRDGHFRIGVLFRDFEQGESNPPLRCLPC